MPKRKGGKKGKGAREEPQIDGVDTTEMSRAQILKYARVVEKALAREREQRLLCQIESDKLRTFWEIERRQLEDTRSEQRNKMRDNDTAEVMHEKMTADMKMTMRHLESEQAFWEGEAQADSMKRIGVRDREMLEMQGELLRDRKGLSNRLQQQADDRLQAKRGIIKDFDMKQSEARDNFMQDCLELDARYERRINTMRADLDLEQRTVLKELEDKKNQQLRDLIESQSREMEDLKIYYNDITLNNLTLIADLKAKLENLRLHEDLTNKRLREAKAENKSLKDPLEKAEKEIRDLQRKLITYEKDKEELEVTRQLLADVEYEHDALRWESEVLLNRVILIKRIVGRMEKSVLEAKAKVAMFRARTAAIAKARVRIISAVWEQLGVPKPKGDLPLLPSQPYRVSMEGKIALARATADHALNQLEIPVCTRMLVMRHELQRLDDLIDDLRWEISRITKSHDELTDSFEKVLEKNGVPAERLGFLPMRTTPMGQGRLAKGPSGLAASCTGWGRLP